MRKAAFLFAAAALLGAAPAAHTQRTVTCESDYGRQNLCRVDTSGGVRLIRQLSESPCRQGSTWGIRREGIWVSRGCRAQFAIGRDGWDGRDDRNRRDGDWNRGMLSTARARAACERAVAARLRTSTRNITTWVDNRRGNNNNVEIGWRAGRRDSGTCRVQRDGDVRVRFDRDRR